MLLRYYLWLVIFISIYGLVHMSARSLLERMPSVRGIVRISIIPDVTTFENTLFRCFTVLCQYVLSYNCSNLWNLLTIVRIVQWWVTKSLLNWWSWWVNICVYVVRKASSVFTRLMHSSQSERLCSLLWSDTWGRVFSMSYRNYDWHIPPIG